MDALSDPMVAEVGLLGPSQAGKTDIGLAWIGWIVDTDPSDTLICQPSQKMAHTFSVTRVEPMIDATKAVKSKLLPFANANNIELKQFQGMVLAMIWPVAAQFAQRPIRFGWLDDYDQMPEDIGAAGDEGGQGSAISLLEGRFTSHEGREKKLVSSSPADEHGGKTEAFIAGGTDERINPRCPECGERWEIDTLKDLKFDDKGTPDDAETSAYVVCGSNGCVLKPPARRALLDSLRSLPSKGFVAANEGLSGRRRTFRVDGLLALTSWGKLARLWREAQIAWQARQDESLLRTFVNTKAGKNYRSASSGDTPLEGKDLHILRDKGFEQGIVPVGPVVITIAVDCQFDRWECIAKAWANGHEGWTIDRWPIDVLDDGITPVEPFRKPEHWDILLKLFDKRFTQVDGGVTPPPLCVAIDIGGGGDKETSTATENAKKFWHTARAAGIAPARLMLLKGSNNHNGPLVNKAQFADKKAKGGDRKTGPRLWLVNTHRAKHILDARLRRFEPGPGRQHYPENFADEYFEELAAEELKKGKWVKRRNRNETLDLELYAWFALLKPPFAQSRDHMGWVPAEYRIDMKMEAIAANPSPKIIEAAQIVPEETKPIVETPAPPPMVKRPAADWINGGQLDW